MATTTQAVDRFDLTLATWATILRSSSPELDTDITNGLWAAGDVELCRTLPDARILIETTFVAGTASGGITPYVRYRYYVPWSDIQPNLPGSYKTLPYSSIDYGDYSTANQIMTFVLKEEN